MEIYLIRHTNINCPEGICYGQSDLEVSETFESELNAVKNKLGNIDDFVFYTSPLKRCLKLAQNLAKSYIIEDRLKEINFGDWELKPWHEIDQAEFQNWLDNFETISCPNGESSQMVYDRNTEFFEELIKKDHKKIIIITHGGVIKNLFAYILKIPLIKAFSLELDYGSISKIKIDKKLIFISYINR